MFVPVIQTRIESRCPAVRVYVLVVAPGIWTQVGGSPTGLHFRQEYANVIGGEPFHTPAVSVRGVSTVLPPRICGVTLSFTGSATTGALDSEFCAAEPRLFVAVTWTRRRFPASALDGV